jgi:hypothetical protein
LDHEARESLEGTRNSDGRADFDEDSFGSMDVDLKFSGFVDRGIEESEKTLWNVNTAHVG